MHDGRVVADAVWKRFRRFGPHPDQDAHRRLSSRQRRTGRGEWWWALADIDFEVEPGAGYAVLGRNGSGKSTLMKLAAGFLFPSTGSVSTGGRVAAIVEITTGTVGDLSGRENIYLLGAVNGRTRQEMNALFDDIVDFAGLGDVIDRPLAFYSSGMKARLAFSTATAVEPDILIVDEALSVGDADFKDRSGDRIRELRGSGCTLLFVSHDMSSVSELCTEGMYLADGRVVAQGPVEDVIATYEQSFASGIEAHPDCPLEILEVRPSSCVTDEGGTAVAVQVALRVGRPLDTTLEVGVASGGLLLLRAASAVTLSAGTSVVEFTFEPLPLIGGRYMTWFGARPVGDGAPYARWQRSGSFDIPGPAAPPRRSKGPRPIPLDPDVAVTVSATR